MPRVPWHVAVGGRRSRRGASSVPWVMGLLMPSSGTYSKLAGSLATVAIATLGGPLLAGRTALGELVKYAQARYEADGQTRDLHRQVTAGIRRWAEGEKLTAEQVELGLARAAEVVAQFGADRGGIADLNFHPSAV